MMNMITKGIFPGVSRSCASADEALIVSHDAFWRHWSHVSDYVMTPFGVIGR